MGLTWWQAHRICSIKRKNRIFASDHCRITRPALSPHTIVKLEKYIDQH